MSAFQGRRFLSLSVVARRGFTFWRGRVRSFRASARLFAVLVVGVGVLAGAVPADAQNPAPTRFRVEAVRHVDGGDAEVDLTWLHPTGASATGFTVRFHLTRFNPVDAPGPGPACALTPTGSQTDLETAGAADRRITIRRLDRETSACFWIRADFAGGSYSGWTRLGTPGIDLRNETSSGTIPAPSRPGVTAGDARVTVLFGHPGNPRACNEYDADGNLTVAWVHARWFYTRRLEGELFGDDPTATVEVTALARTAGGSHPVVQNIVNRNSYVFKIRLQCQGAISPWSEESEVVIPRGTIEEITEPQGLSVVPSRVAGRDTAALRLTWGHPSSGTPDRYRLRYGLPRLDPEGKPLPPATSVILPGSSLSYVITGLQFDTDYQIWLRAESEDARPDCEEQRGHVEECGPWAKTSGNTGGANRAPVAVEDLEAIVLEVGSTHDVDVAHYFSDPDGDELTFSAFSQNGAVATVASSGAPSSFTITAVSAGTATVSISATDPGGLSVRAGIEVTVQEEPLPVLPGVPTAVEAFLGPEGPAVLWEPPSPVEGAVVAAYRVSWRDDVNRVWRDPVHLGVDARTWAPMVDAVPGRTYEFRVRAVSDSGAAGPWSAPATVAVPELPVPGTPLNLRLEADGADLVATWDEPADIASVPVTGYTLRYRGTGIDDKWRTEDVPAGTLRARIPASYGLEYGGTYRAQVRASGAGGDGLWSAEAETTLEDITVPGPPRMVTGTWSGTVLTVRWREPANAAADDFEIQHYRVGLARADWVSDPQDVTPDRALEAVFDDPEIWPGCMYAITVSAHATTDAPNAPTILKGDPAKIEYMPGQPPCAQREVPRGAPRSLHVTRDAGMAITVAWDVWSPPVDPAGVGVVYALEVADPDETVVQSLADLGGAAHTVADLELYVDYRFRVRAGFRYNQTEPVHYGPWSPRARRYSEDARLEVEIGDDQEFETAVEYDTLGFSVRLSGETPRPVSVRLEVFQNGSREPVDVSAGQPLYGLSSGNGGRLDFLPGLARDPWIYADFHEGLEPTDQILIVLSEPEPAGFVRLGTRSRLQCTGAGVCGATPVPTMAPAGALILAAILAGVGWRRTRG